MNYIIQHGDTLYSIAKKFKVRLTDLLANNRQITNPNMILPGQVVFIPTRLCPTLRIDDQGPAVSRVQIILQFLGVYKGKVDGLFGPQTLIAIKEWQGRVKEIEVTGIVDTDTWYSLGAECAPRPSVTQYIVRPGSTLYLIAAWFGVSAESILQINPQITNPNMIYAGQVIHIPVSE